MTTTGLFAASLATCAVGAVAVPFLARHAQRVSVAFVTVASLLAAGAAASILAGAPPMAVPLWDLASLGPLSLSLDPLGALFLAVTALVFLASAPYAACEAAHYRGRRPAWFAACYLLLLASIAVVLAAGDVLTFLIGWESTSLLVYALVSFGAEGASGNRAAYLMIAMSEAGAVAGGIGLLLVAASSGTIEFAALRTAPALEPGTASAVFVLTFFGFGVKAGLVPVNQWLADTYTAAPRAFAPVLAGATTNLGIYAILRVNADLVPPAGLQAGLVVLVAGSVSALVGILYATVQSDVRRLLAHSSIENMGIIVTVVGAGMVYAAAGHPVVAGIAFIAALYHTVNHSVYKTLLFIGAGAVETSTGTRDLDRWGGLIRRMPWTAGLILLGVAAIAGLPPLNGFVSEWFALQTMLRAAELSPLGPKVVFALCGAALALTAGLAITCFVKLYAMGFLGISRSAGVERAGETPAAARYPMAVLALVCVLLGVLPTFVVPVLDRVAAPVAGAPALEALVPAFYRARPGSEQGMRTEFLAEFHDLGAQIGQTRLPGRGLVVLHRGGEANPVMFAMSTSYMAIVLVLLLALTYALMRLAGRGRTVSRGATWAGGLRRLSPAITYTATGFSNPVRVVFDAVLRPATREDTTRAVAEHFRTAVRRERTEVHVIERLFLHPAVALIRGLANALRGMHRGQVNVYAAYVLAALLVALVLAL